jgi:ATP-dependent helicase/nuclease subunit A
MIRGLIDGVLAESAGIEIVDYKTDDVSAAQLDDRVSLYRTQVELYVRAAGEMFRRPVTAAWLVFLSPRRVVEVPLQPAD